MLEVEAQLRENEDCSFFEECPKYQGYIKNQGIVEGLWNKVFYNFLIKKLYCWSIYVMILETMVRKGKYNL